MTTKKYYEKVECKGDFTSPYTTCIKGYEINVSAKGKEKVICDSCKGSGIIKGNKVPWIGVVLDKIDEMTNQPIYFQDDYKGGLERAKQLIMEHIIVEEK
mgnify:CR=1 FL=1